MVPMTEPTGRIFKSLWQDTDGFILPYVTVTLVVIIGVSLLAFDGARYMSLQSQMQSAADALALAGARELDQQPGAETRATSAINNLVSNGLSGMGVTAPLTVSTPVFYSALPSANTGFTGTLATGDSDARFVAVTVAPVTVNTIFPVSFINAAGANSFSAGAQAIAGNAGVTVCGVPPVYICNPYETAGMSDAAATDALNTALADPSTTRRQIRMNTSQTGSSGPGHFGYLVPPDNNNGASNLKDWIARTAPKTCYTKSRVDLNTGAMTSVQDGFNVRFDIYNGSISYSTNYAPSVNVRKGYVPGSTGTNRWCNAAPDVQYYTQASITFTGTTGGPGNPQTITNVSSIAGLQLNAPISGSTIPIGSFITDINSQNSTVRISNNTTGSLQNNITFSSGGVTSGLPLDNQWTDICSGGTCLMGNGDWNCLSYWTINHPGVSAPTGCTASNPTLSRYDVYRKEIDVYNNQGDWSGNGRPNLPPGAGNTGNGESGAPYCAGTGNGVDTSTGGTDRRALAVAVINCLAQQSKLSGGQTANNIPVAAFAKFFMTQPINADPSDYLYGEMTGQLLLSDKILIMNEVQLYR